MAAEDDEGDYIVEFRVVGNAVKVSAVDPATLTEVSIVGPVTAGRAELEQAAVRKLKYVLAKTKPPKGGAGGPGRLV